jgi:limonene-1,2-epoxide hydrolase
VSGARVQGSALYLAANGCNVTAIEPEADVVQRVLTAAQDAGLQARVRGLTTELSAWNPDGPLAAVICTPAAFAGLSAFEREKVIAVLQRATADGGVHLVETIVAGQEAISEDELKACYSDWDVSFVQEPGAAKTFLARKHTM